MSKRTELMVSEDRARVSELLARGYRNKSEMARIINQGRAEQFHIGPQQVGKDIEAMKQAYLERGFENLEIYRHTAMNELLYLLQMYYEGYEKSKINKMTVESIKSMADEDEYNEFMDGEHPEQLRLEGVHPFGREGKVKEEGRGEGNPAFLTGAKAVLDSLNKIRAVDGSTKVSLTDPTGTEEYSGMAELMKSRIAELSNRDAPADTDQLLLAAPPEPEDEDK